MRTPPYRQLRERLGDRWIQKLQFLLYEGAILPEHAAAFAEFDGVILQGKPDAAGVSKNPCIAALQRGPDAADDETDTPTYH